MTVEDVRRAYYDSSSTPMSWWITELQLAPTSQLIVCDEASANTYRVPVTIKGLDISFGDPVQVQTEYVDTPAKTAAKIAASRGRPSRDAEDPEDAVYRSLFGDTPAGRSQRASAAQASEDATYQRLFGGKRDPEPDDPAYEAIFGKDAK